MSSPRCQERYYPEWSSRGMRPVDCMNRASWRMTGTTSKTGTLLCGVHKNRYERNFPHRTYMRL